MQGFQDNQDEQRFAASAKGLLDQAYFKMLAKSGASGVDTSNALSQVYKATPALATVTSLSNLTGYRATSKPDGRQRRNNRSGNRRIRTGEAAGYRDDVNTVLDVGKYRQLHSDIAASKTMLNYWRNHGHDSVFIGMG